MFLLFTTTVVTVLGLSRAASGTTTFLRSASHDDPIPPCCKNCTEGTVKYFSVVTNNGYCAESCLDPSKFSEYHLFEKNLTRADTNEACAGQYAADGEQYTKYVYTETHSVPGILKVEVDFYAQTNAPDHKCCYSEGGLLCIGKPVHLTVAGVKYCCPKGATQEQPCPSSS